MFLKYLYLSLITFNCLEWSLYIYICYLHCLCSGYSEDMCENRSSNNICYKLVVSVTREQCWSIKVIRITTEQCDHTWSGTTRSVSLRVKAVSRSRTERLTSLPGKTIYFAAEQSDWRRYWKERPTLLRNKTTNAAVERIDWPSGRTTSPAARRSNIYIAAEQSVCPHGRTQLPVSLNTKANGIAAKQRLATRKGNYTDPANSQSDRYRCETKWSGVEGQGRVMGGRAGREGGCWVCGWWRTLRAVVSWFLSGWL